MARLFLIIAAALGFSGVALGAFGAHALKERVTADLLAIYQMAVQYHLIHAVALLGVGVWALLRPGPGLTTAGVAFILGTVIFSGSLYVLVMTGVRTLGAVTPFGGLAFLVGWAALAWAAWKLAV